MKCDRCKHEENCPAKAEYGGAKRCSAFKPQEMTNEEYLRSLNTEQKAEFLLNAIQKCKRCASGIGVADDDDSCPLGGCWDVKDVVEWLKQPHTFE